MMQEERFQSWLRQTRGYETSSADSHVGRAKTCETFFGVDLDLAAGRGQIPALIEQTMTRDDLAESSKVSYAAALRRYAEFCGH